MGDFNPNNPTMDGSEFFPGFQRTVDLGANPLAGVAMRVRPGAITPVAAHYFDRNPLNSLHMMELQDTLTPVLTTETIFPGTDTGADYGAGEWVTETGAAAAFGKVAKNNDDTTYLTMTGGIGDATLHSAVVPGYHGGVNFGGAAPLTLRGNRSALLGAAPTRAVAVTINARIAVDAAYTANIFQFVIKTANGNYIYMSGAYKPKGDGVFRTFSFTLPADPWLMATVNAPVPFWNGPHQTQTWDNVVSTSGPLNFGIAPIDTGGGGGGTSNFKVSGLWLTMVTCPENRQYCAYPRAPLAAGWNRIGKGTHSFQGPLQRSIIFTSNAATTALTTPAMAFTAAGNGAGNFTANDIGKTIVRASDGQVVGTVQSVTNSTTAVLTANGASTNTSVLGYLGTAPVALSANTYYYAVHGQTAWASKSRILMDIVQDPNLVVTTSASATGEHRTVYNLVFSSSGSMVAGGAQATTVTAAAQTTGEMLPTLLDDGAIKSQSQPYTNLAALTALNEIRSGGSNLGQQVTAVVGTTYAAVKIALARYSLTKDPDQPLTIEIRHGAGSLTGGGTLDATATVYPTQLKGTKRKPTTIEVAFAASFASASVQYVVFLKSNATTGRGWAYALLDTRSDLIAAGSTIANIEGAGIGGQTDAADLSGAANTRYDIPVALCAPPTAPTGLSVTAKAAT